LRPVSGQMRLVPSSAFATVRFLRIVGKSVFHLASCNAAVNSAGVP
jgi:hypothetical protein